MAFEKVEKESLTKELMLLDIRDAARSYTPKIQPQYESIILLAGALIVLLTVFLTGKPAFFGLYLLPLAAAVGIGLLKSRKIHRLSAEDITVDTDTAVSIEERTIVKGKGRYETALILHFDGSGEWEIPYQNYRWSRTYRMSRSGVSHTTLCGDPFWIVRRRDTGEIVIAYNQKFFRYEKE